MIYFHLYLSSRPFPSLSLAQPSPHSPCFNPLTPVHILADRSAIIISNYVGGSLTLHALQPDGTLGAANPLSLPFAYEGKEAPNKERQDASHAHGVVEVDGKLYAADLGSDRVYVVIRKGEGLEVEGWIQCVKGFGPRHCAVSRDGEFGASGANDGDGGGREGVG